MPSTKEQLIKQARQGKTHEERQTEALEGIVDALGRIQSELVSIRSRLPQGKAAGSSFGR